MEWCLSDDPKCGNKHTNSCSSCNECWQLPEDLANTLHELKCSAEERDTLRKEVDTFEENLSKYIPHLIRGKYQCNCYMKEVADLKPGHVIAVSDYMMKLMFRRLYEPQKEWFGKKVHLFMGSCFFTERRKKGSY